jgi:hypothetical protein
VSGGLDRELRRHLMAWGTGRGGLTAGHPTGAATVLLEDRMHMADLLASDAVGPGSVVFCPGSGPTAAPGSGPQVVHYSGSVREPGTDIAVGDDFFLQVQDYATSEYLSVIGATLVRITGDGDLEAFLADADRAMAEGLFPPFVTDPAVQLADVAALGGPWREDGPRVRLYVGPAGEMSVSPGGLRLGSLGEPHAELQRRWEGTNTASAAPCAVALGATLDDDAARSRALLDRPWLGRYLHAVDALRELGARGEATGLQVSGFGCRLRPEVAAVERPADLDAPGADLPVLLWNADAAYLHRRGRTFRLDAAAAPLIELLLVLGRAHARALAPDRDLSTVEAHLAGLGMPFPEPAGA